MENTRRQPPPLLCRHPDLDQSGPRRVIEVVGGVMATVVPMKIMLPGRASSMSDQTPIVRAVAVVACVMTLAIAGSEIVRLADALFDH